MTTDEKNLVLSLAAFADDENDFLPSLASRASTPEVLGQLMFNRIGAIAYGTLMQHGMCGVLNREFRNPLRHAYEYNLISAERYRKSVANVAKICADSGVPHAFLKGAVLCEIYPDGYRSANDIDILVGSHDVTALGRALRNSGFRQGYLRGGVFRSATREEIIGSRMNRGETVPYVFGPDGNGAYTEVDLNYSLDFKAPRRGIVEDMLSRAGNQPFAPNAPVTLDMSDFFIHLCLHLYKEASTYSWLRMGRDLSLYKFCDVYLAILTMGETGAAEALVRADKYGVADAVACVIVWTGLLFRSLPRRVFESAMDTLAEDFAILDRVIDPERHIEYEYFERDIVKRLFSRDRTSLLFVRRKNIKLLRRYIYEKTENERTRTVGAPDNILRARRLRKDDTHQTSGGRAVEGSQRL